MSEQTKLEEIFANSILYDYIIFYEWRLGVSECVWCAFDVKCKPKHSTFHRTWRCDIPIH